MQTQEAQLSRRDCASAEHYNGGHCKWHHFIQRIDSTSY